MAEPDFGTAVTYISILLAILFFSDLKLKEILKWSIIGLCIALVLFGISWFSFFKPYQKERILTFWILKETQKKREYQINQAKIAVGSGKMFGKGLHSGTQNRLKFLPAPHTDFIVAVVGEELGFIGVASVCLFFFDFAFKISDRRRNHNDTRGKVRCPFYLFLVFVPYHREYRYGAGTFSNNGNTNSIPLLWWNISLNHYIFKWTCLEHFLKTFLK